MPTLNVVMDFVLIAAAVWMVLSVRGLGGIIGKGLNLITIGALILGVAHLLATGLHTIVVNTGMDMDAPTESFIHRVIVLVGFIVLVVGFRRIEAIKK